MILVKNLLLKSILSIAVSIVIFYVLKWIFSQASNYIKMSKLPGPPHRNLMIGNFTYFHGPPEHVFSKLREACRDYYPIYQVCALHKISANILTPEDAELVLSNPVHIQKGQPYDLLKTWLKDGLLTSTGEKWQTRRKILTPAFHFNILQSFIQVFNEESEKLVKVLKKECTKSFVKINTHVGQFTLKIIAETAMGTKLKFQSQKEKDYKQAIIDMCEILLYKFLRPWFIISFLNYFSPKFLQECRVTNTLHKFTKDVIREREENFTDIELPKEEEDVYKSKKRLAMLDLLLSTKKNDGLIDDEGIQEEVDTFTFAGHDTTATALGFLLMLLACNKTAQEQVVQEMKEVLGGVHKKPSFNDLQELKFLERCIKESLRLYPSVATIMRTLGADLTTHTGFRLPKTTIVGIHIYDIHHDPDIYPDPEKFDPDRFLPENSQDRHPFAYLPFSAGPRNCIGQRFAMLELKAAVCAILANFVLEPIDTPETIVLVLDLVQRTKEDIKIRFIPRK